MGHARRGFTIARQGLTFQAKEVSGAAHRGRTGHRPRNPEPSTNMPTYEYRCPEGHEFELFQRMSDEPGAECPACGRRAERLLSAGAGFLFKGDGFYITDYRPESYRKEASADRKGEGSSGSSGESSSAPEASPKKTSDGGSKGGGATAAEKSGGRSPSGPKKAD